MTEAKPKQPTPLAIVTGDILGTRDEFMAVLSDQNINFDRESAFAIQIIQSNDYLLRIAMDSRQSVVNAVRNIAAIGISLNPARKQAYLVPRGGVVCLDISYMGLLDLAIASGSIRWGQAKLVRANDHYESQGVDLAPIHKFNPFKPDERGEVVGAYVVVKTADGDYLTHEMAIGEIFDIRDRSESWKSYVKDNKKKTPWITDMGEMVKKVVIKQASKTWPKTDRLDHAVHHLNTDGGEGLVDINEKPEPAEPVKHAMGAKAFERALAAIVAGEYTVKEIEQTYTLTEDQRTLAVEAEKGAP